MNEEFNTMALSQSLAIINAYVDRSGHQYSAKKLLEEAKAKKIADIDVSIFSKIRNGRTESPHGHTIKKLSDVARYCMQQEGFTPPNLDRVDHEEDRYKRTIEIEVGEFAAKLINNGIVSSEKISELALSAINSYLSNLLLEEAQKLETFITQPPKSELK